MTPKDVMSKYNYMKADYPTISSELSKVHWDTLLNKQSIDANWNTFKSVILAISSKYTPKVNKKCVSNKPPWWSTQISKAVRDKQHLFSQYKYTHSVADYASYAVKRNQVKSISSAKTRHDKILIQNLTTNPKALYGYVRDKNKVKTSIGQLEKLDGSLTNGEKKVVEVLNDFFQSVFTKEDPSSIPGFSSRVGCTLDEIYITEMEVYDKLSSLNPNKAPGPDGVPSQLLKNYASSLTHPLFLLYTQSLNSGIIPEEWKKANIMPIFKKGSKTKAKNYRPISLTSQLVKILESIIRTKVMKYLIDNNIVTHYQHGFVSKKSCFTNLLETFEDWTAAVDRGCGVNVIYLDYSKAFDTVPHLRLIEKLKGYGISGSLLMWLTNFLQGRSQRVVLNGIQSQWLEVTSGVPQGSVLGPLLFVLYINDIAENIQCKLGVFADDTKMYSIINNMCNTMELQCDLDNMQEWCRTWLLKLNLEKCKVMHIGKSLNTTYKMKISGSPGSCIDLCEVNSEKDLGLWYVERISCFSVQNICKAPLRILCQIVESILCP